MRASCWVLRGRAALQLARRGSEADAQHESMRGASSRRVYTTHCTPRVLSVRYVELPRVASVFCALEWPHMICAHRGSVAHTQHKSLRATVSGRAISMRTVVCISHAFRMRTVVFSSHALRVRAAVFGGRALCKYAP